VRTPSAATAIQFHHEEHEVLKKHLVCFFFVLFVSFVVKEFS